MLGRDPDRRPDVTRLDRRAGRPVTLVLERVRRQLDRGARRYRRRTPTSPPARRPRATGPEPRRSPTPRPGCAAESAQRSRPRPSPATAPANTASGPTSTTGHTLPASARATPSANRTASRTCRTQYSGRTPTSIRHHRDHRSPRNSRPATTARELVQHRVHQRRVERMRHPQPLRASQNSLGDRQHSGLGTGNHHRRRPVHRRDRHPVDQAAAAPRPPRPESPPSRHPQAAPASADRAPTPA